METFSSKTDSKGRLTLPEDFVSCLVVVERNGDELVIRKAKKVVACKYSFKELMSGVTRENIHGEADTGPAVGKEAL